MTKRQELVKNLFSFKSTRILTLAILFLLPILYLNAYSFQATTRYFVFSIVTLITTLLTGWTWLKVTSIPKSLFKSWYGYGLVVYCAILTIVSLLSIDPGLSFFSSFMRTNGTWAFIVVTLFSLNLYTLIQIYGKQFLYKSISASVLGAVLVSVLIILSPAGFSVTPLVEPFKNPGGTFANSSLAAAYILWNIFFAVLLILSTKGKQKILWISSLVLLIANHLFIHWRALFGIDPLSSIQNLIGEARGATLGLFVGLVVSVGTYLSFNVQKIKKYIGFGIIGATAIGILIFNVVLINPSSKLHETFISGATGTRFVFWDIATQAFLDKPIQGWGPGTYGYVYHKYFNPNLVLAENNKEVFADHPHSIIFENLYGGGILLMSAFAFLLISIIQGIRRKARLKELSPIEASLVLGALIAWLFQDLFVFDSLASLVMLGIACAIAYGESSKEEIVKPSLNGKIVYGALSALVLIIFIYGVYFPLKKINYIESIYKAKLVDRVKLWPGLAGISSAGDAIDSTILFNGLFNSYNSQAERIRREGGRLQIVSLQEIDEIINYLNTIISKKDFYELVYINTRFHYLRMSIADDFSGEMYKDAVQLAQRGIKLSPNDPQMYNVAAQIAAGRGDTVQAKELLEQSLQIQPRFSGTYQLVLQLAIVMKDKAYYQTMLAQAKELIPNFKPEYDYR